MIENLGVNRYFDKQSDDLKIARVMQKALLPSQSEIEQISQSHKLSIACHSESPDELAGDFWGVDVLDDDRIFIYIADFSGHGLSAALNTFRLHSIISIYGQEVQNNILSPADYLGKLNRDLYALLPTELYATMLCGIVDLKRDVFTFAAAAPTAPMKMTIGKPDILALDPSGIPLGMIEDAAYEDRDIPFGKNEMLFFYSDALIESHNVNGELLGEEKFIDLCRETSVGLDPSAIFLDSFLKKFDHHVIRPLQDDLTAVTLTRG